MNETDTPTVRTPSAEGEFPSIAEPAKPKSTALSIAGDILAGAEAIAEFLFGDRRHRRKVYNLVESGQLPVFRLGVNICARKSVLLDWIARQERGEAAAPSMLSKSGDHSSPLR